MSKAPTATTRCGDVSSSSGNEAQRDTLAASAVGGNAEVVLIEQNDDSGRNNNGPSAKKTKLGMHSDLEPAAALIPSGSGASKPETGTVQRHDHDIHAAEVVSDTTQRRLDTILEEEGANVDLRWNELNPSGSCHSSGREAVHKSSDNEGRNEAGPAEGISNVGDDLHANSDSATCEYTGKEESRGSGGIPRRTKDEYVCAPPRIQR